MVSGRRETCARAGLAASASARLATNTVCRLNLGQPRLNLPLSLRLNTHALQIRDPSENFLNIRESRSNRSPPMRIRSGTKTPRIHLAFKQSVSGEGRVSFSLPLYRDSQHLEMRSAQ